jgi:hypothetical protein
MEEPTMDEKGMLGCEIGRKLRESEKQPDAKECLVHPLTPPDS